MLKLTDFAVGDKVHDITYSDNGVVTHTSIKEVVVRFGKHDEWGYTVDDIKFLGKGHK